MRLRHTREGARLVVYVLAVLALLWALFALPACAPRRPLSKPKFAVSS